MHTSDPNIILYIHTHIHAKVRSKFDHEERTLISDRASKGALTVNYFCFSHLSSTTVILVMLFSDTKYGYFTR